MLRLNTLLLSLLLFLPSVLRAQSTVGGTATLGVSSATPITIALVPPSSTVAVSSTQIFGVSITNDFNNAGANLTLSGNACSGATCGTLSNSVAIKTGASILYTAPATAPSDGTVVLTATSIQDPSKFFNVPITITSLVSGAQVRNINPPPTRASAASQPFAVTPTVGNFIIAEVFANAGSTITGVTDDKGNTYADVGCQSDIAGNAHVAQFYSAGATPGVQTVTVADPSPVGGMAVVILDASNISATPLVDAQCGGSTLATTSAVGPTVNTAAGGLVVSSIGTGHANSVSSPFIFDILANNSNGGAHALPTANATLTPTWNINSSGWAGVTSSFSSGSTPNVVRVDLQPVTATVQTSANQNFTPTVFNDSASGGVTLGLTGAGCSGASCGTLSASGSRSATINSNSDFTGTSGASTMTLSGSGALSAGTVGNFLAITAVVPSSTMTITGATDNMGNTWAVGGAAIDSTGGDQTLLLYTSSAALPGVTSISITSTSPSGSLSFFLYDVSLSPSTFTAQFQHTSNGALTTNPVGPAITPTGSGFTLAVISPSTGTPSAIAAPFTRVQSSAYDLNSTTSTLTPSWTTGSGTWCSSVMSVVEGSGTVPSGTGVTYTAPASVPSPATVTLTATSVTDPTKTDTSVITIATSPALSVSLSPASTQSITAGVGTLSFTPTVANDGAHLGVTWTLSVATGTLSASSSPSGTPVTYTPPGSVSSTQSITLTATSISNGTKTASVTILVSPANGPPTFTGASFPGAQGSGATSVGGRGGSVIEVTNLNDSGTGSLRNCITASGPRTCVFRVAGEITQHSDLTVSNPFITIAGQTAPGQIILGGTTSAGFTLRISAHDTIVRYLTISPDNTTQPTGPDTGTVGYSLVNAVVNPAIADHLSVRWSGNKSYNITSNFGACLGDHVLQWSLSYENHEAHPVGISSSSNDNATTSACMKNADYHHNLIVNQDHRIPEYNEFSMRWINNIVYNWSGYALQGLGATQTDVINNIWEYNNLVPGSSQSGPHPIHSSNTSSSNQWGGSIPGIASFYISGNMGHGHTTPNTDQYGDLAQSVDGEPGNEQGVMPTGARRSTPLAPAGIPIVPDPATQLSAIISPTVGNSQHLDCNGTWVSHRDTADARVVNQWLTRGTGGFWPNGVTYTGVIYCPPATSNCSAPPGQSAPFAIPTIQQAYKDLPVTNFPVCTETLHDGIPDAWRTKYGINADKNAIDPVSHYTELENYLDGIVPHQ